jgi:hypothetical protein
MTSLSTRAAPQALASPMKSLRRAFARWLEERRTAVALAAAARRALAAQEACADEGALMEYAVVEIDGRRFGALYQDGRLKCLLPDQGRL